MLHVINLFVAQVNQIELKVKAQDLGSPPQSSEVPVTIIITSDPAELPPEWKPWQDQDLDDINNIIMLESSPQGTELDIKPSAEAQTGNSLYTLIAGRTPQENGLRDFRYLGNPGDTEMTIQIQKLDYETTTEYWLRLRASVSIYHLQNVNIFLSF